MSTVAKKIMMGSGAVALPSDDQFNRVSFLSHFDGANNGVNNAFDDGSASNHTITANGNVTQGSFGPFARPDGEWGWNFDGDGDKLTLAASSDFAAGTGDFTFETFLFKTETTSSGQYDGIFYSATTQRIKFQASDSIINIQTSARDVAIVNNDQGTFIGVWRHLAVCRSSNTLRTYVDGTLATTITLNSDETFGTSSPSIIIGQNTDYFGGLMSNFRYVVGSALHTGSSLTVPTSPLTAVTNTKLLTCQSNRFVDNSASGHTVTPSGNVAVTAFGAILTSKIYSAATNGASAYLDGDGDYLQAANSADFDLGTGNFTWECYANIADITRTQWFFSVFTTSSGQNAWGLRLESNGTLNAYFSGDGGESPTVVGVAAASSGLTENAWHHIAVVKNGTGSNNIQVYVDGVSKVTGTFGAIHDTNLPFRVGRQGNDTYAQYFLGYISDVRIVKGTAVYTGNFTPPTAPLTAITNTKMLLNMADGQAIDSAAQNNLTLYGTAKTSTAQKKFGTASLLLDGNSDFAYLHNRNNLSGPFCIEAWGWADNLPSAGCTLWCLGTYKIQLQVTNDTVRIYRVGTAEGYTNFFTGGEFSVDTWHHVALVRDTSNVIKCYLNGTASGTTVTDATAFLATSGIFIIGAEADGDPVNQNVLDPWDGYIDDFRISNFARYTSNFTAPTKAFADKGQ